MPKEISHIYFSEIILDSLSLEIKNIINKNKNLYYYGSTSPDLFYYYLPNKKILKNISDIDWGSLIHDNPQNMEPIYHFLSFAKGKEYQDQIFSFLAGFFTHVAGDTIFHPYIYSITGYYYNPDPSLQREFQRNHRLFETIMDLFILNKIYQVSLKDFQLTKKLTLKENELKIVRLYGKTIKDYFYPDIPDEPMNEFVNYCYKNHIRLVRLFQLTWLTNVLILFKRFSKHLDSILALCYGKHPESQLINFYQFMEAPHPIYNTKMKGNFFEYTKKIQKRGCDFINTIYEFLYQGKNIQWVKKRIPHFSLNTGEIQISHEEMKYFNIHPAFKKAS